MDTEDQTELLASAADWYARLAAPDCSVRDRAEFQRWLTSDPRHAAAFATIERTDAGVSRAAQDVRLRQLAEAAFAAGIEVSDAAADKRRRLWFTKVPLALAATVLVCIAALRLIPELEASRVAAVMYATAPGETRTLTLADGSVVSLDVASSIAVRLRAAERAIELISGRAHFQVAHDATRPFAVTAGNVRTVALGTQFQVQDERGEISVTLLEGSVLVRDAAESEGAWREKLQPGEQLRIAYGASTPQRRTVNSLVVAGWLRGRLVFEDTPLSEALAEINRYSQRKLRLGDPSLADLRIGGNFIAGDTRTIAAALSAALPVELVEGGDQEIILFRRH